MSDPPVKNSGKKRRKAKNRGQGITPLNQRSETVTKQFSVVTSRYTLVTKPQLFLWLLATEQRLIVSSEKKTQPKQNKIIF